MVKMDVKGMLLLILCLLLAFVDAGASPASPAQDPVRVEVDVSTRYQRIDGFGTSLTVGFEAFERGHFDEVVPYGVTYKLTPKQRDGILTTAVRELGVSHARLWLWPLGIEQQNDNDDPQVMDWNAFTWAGQSGRPASSDIFDNRQNGIIEWGELLKKAVPLGLTNWILTPGRLPGWLLARFKDPADTTKFEEYAEYAAAHVLYLKRMYRLEAPYWSMFNEPDVVGWKSAELWIPWIKATGRRFRKEGLATRIVFPDTAGVQEAVSLSAEVLQDPEVRQYLGALAYHHYRSSGHGPQPFVKLAAGTSKEETAKLLAQVTDGPRAMAELARRYGLPSWQTETAYYPTPVKGLSEWEIGLARANEIHLELVSGASAVEGMSMFWPEAVDPRYGVTVRHEGHHIVARSDGRVVRRWEVTKDAGVVFAHYGRYVRPGDWRVAAETADPFVKATAFVSPTNDKCIVVLINNSVPSRKIVLKLKGLEWADVHQAGFVTDASRAFKPQQVGKAGTTNSLFETTLPPKSISTFVWSREQVRPLRVLTGR